MNVGEDLVGAVLALFDSSFGFGFVSVRRLLHCGPNE